VIIQRGGLGEPVLIVKCPVPASLTKDSSLQVNLTRTGGLKFQPTATWNSLTGTPYDGLVRRGACAALRPSPKQLVASRRRATEMGRGGGGERDRGACLHMPFFICLSSFAVSKLPLPESPKLVGCVSGNFHYNGMGEIGKACNYPTPNHASLTHCSRGFQLL
jgi:hypothetical protein